MSIKSTSWYQVNIFLTFSQFAILSKTYRGGGGEGGCGVKLQAGALREDICLLVKTLETPVILYILQNCFSKHCLMKNVENNISNDPLYFTFFAEYHTFYIHIPSVLVLNHLP